MSMAPADQVVSHYFSAARHAARRTNSTADAYAANAERLSALFVLLSGFEAFLNCYFRILADELGDPCRSKIIAIADNRREALRGKALKLPWQAFGSRSKAMDAAIAEIEQYIAIRHRFMHLKHDWSSITTDNNVTIRDLMDTTVMNHDLRWKLLPLFVAIRRYMKATFALRGDHRYFARD
ncbi:MAG: hypothetical protein RB191_09130 [Terriglobia bacterium]|nr:hypothetical protein [Terriglobia bacterium]